MQVVGIKSAGIKTKEEWGKHFPNSESVRVYFTRGGAVLGTDTDPMCLTVKHLLADWRGEIKILVFDPNSKYISDRTRELDMKNEQVKEQCLRVMSNIDHLRNRHNINIRGRYCDSKPFLRFTLFDDFGFFSYPAWGTKYNP